MEFINYVGPLHHFIDGHSPLTQRAYLKRQESWSERDTAQKQIGQDDS